MAQDHITIDLKKIQEAFAEDRGGEVLVEAVVNQLLPSEMTDHLQADRYERSDERIWR